MLLKFFCMTMHVRNKTCLPGCISLILLLLNCFAGRFHLNYGRTFMMYDLLAHSFYFVKKNVLKPFDPCTNQWFFAGFFQRFKRFISDQLGMKIRGYCLAHVFVCLSIYLCIRPTRCIRMQSVKNLILNSIDSLLLTLIL